MSRRDRLVLSASASGAGADASIEGPRRPPIPAGAKVRYVPLDGNGACEATVKGASRGGLDLDVFSPGCSIPLALSGVRLYDGFAIFCPPGHCFSPTKGESA